MDQLEHRNIEILRQPNKKESNENASRMEDWYESIANKEKVNVKKK